jgi:hypothetical protein
MNCTKSTPRKISKRLKSQSITPPRSTMNSKPFKMTAYRPATITNIARPPRIFAVDTVTTSSFIDGGGKGLFISMMRVYSASKLCYTLQESELFEDFANVRAAAGAGQKPNFFAVFLSTPRDAAAKKKSTFLTKSPSKFSCTFLQKVHLFDVKAAGCQVSKLHVFYNLMDSLAAEVKLICNLAERRTRSAHLQNFGISGGICGRTRLQRSPLPTRNSLDGRSSVIRKLVFSTTLTHIANPCSQSDVVSINSFYMNSRNIAMSFTSRKLLQGFDVCIEACSVIHRQDIIREPMGHVDDALFFIIPQHLTEVTR